MNLKELRKENGKTQQELAEYLNISQVTYGRYELETHEPNIETLCKLADLYSVSLDYLVNRQFNNQFGYLSNDEKELISMYRNLNYQNKAILLGEAKAFAISQR